MVEIALSAARKDFMERKILAKKKSAWLIKWAGQSSMAKDIISLRNSNISSEKIKEFIKYYYESIMYSPLEMIEDSKEYKVEEDPLSDNLFYRPANKPEEPYISARKVENLKIYSDGTVEHDVIKVLPREDEE